jgi:ABC-type Fe3+/spermidine/putrescine transport system ATPase subunit
VLQERLGFTAIYVTHDQAEAFSLAETVAVMNRGRIETIGDPRTVFGRPRTPFVAEFLGLNMHRGRVVQCLPRRDGGGFFVEVAVSADFKLWGVATGDQPVAAGQNVLACTRKEHITVAKSGDAARNSVTGTALGEPPLQVFDGITRAASFLGLEEEYIIAIDGIEIGAIQPPRGLHAGTCVTVTIRPQDCIVFVADRDSDGG